MHKSVHIIMIVLAVLAVIALSYGIYTRVEEKYTLQNVNSSLQSPEGNAAAKRTLINRACCPHYGQCGSHYAHVPWGMTYDGRYVPLA